MTSGPDTQEAKVAILGGGVAGSATALALARRGLDGVVMLEASRFERLRIGESLLPDARRLLELLGVWPDFVSEGHERCLGSRSAWGSRELGFNDFLFDAAGVGWHLDRQRFDGFLASKAREAGTELRVGARYRSATRSGDTWRIDFTSEDGTPGTLSAGHVVDATGARASVSSRQGAKRLEFSQSLFVYGFFDQVRPSSWAKLTLLEATEHGWWYAAHVPGGRVAVAVTADAAEIARLGLRQLEGWLRALGRTDHVADFVGRDRRPTQPLLARQAPSFLSSYPAGESWLAVGDAASSFDPITGQGIHKALADGLLAADYIAGVQRGDLPDFGGYARAVSNRFRAYVSGRGYLYDLETRWPDAPFWRARRSATARRGHAADSGPDRPGGPPGAMPAPAVDRG